MPRIEGLRSPSDKTLAGLNHLGRMLDKMRLMHAGTLPEDFHRNYGLSMGLDGQLCGFLGLEFARIEARVKEGGTHEGIAEWIFANSGFRPNRQQAQVWNEYSRKFGWNDRASGFVAKVKAAAGLPPDHPACTAFELIDWSEADGGDRV